MKLPSLVNGSVLLVAVLLSLPLAAQTIVPIPPAQDPQIESHVKAFLKVLNSGGGKPLEQMAPKDARAVLVGAQKSVKVDLSGTVVTEKTIVQDGLSVKIIVVKPAGAVGTLPAFMFFHGGGWVLGDFPTHQRMLRDLVVASGAVGVFVNYRTYAKAKAGCSNSCRIYASKNPCLS